MLRCFTSSQAKRLNIFTSHRAIAVSRARRIIVLNEFWRSSALSSHLVTNESEMVSRHAAFLPRTLALWKWA